jgi:PAS domain S-box-containing protein
MNRNIPELEAEEIQQQEFIAEFERPESVYREVLAASPYGILVNNSEGKILLFNSRLEQITGYAANEIPDIPTWFRLIYPNEEYRKIVRAEPRNESSPGIIWAQEVMITCRDSRSVMCRFTSVRQESGLRIIFIQPVEDSAALAASLTEEEY